MIGWCSDILIRCELPILTTPLRYLRTLALLVFLVLPRLMKSTNQLIAC